MEAVKARETSGERLIRLWQEREQARQKASREILEKGRAGFEVIHADHRFYSFIYGLVGEQVTVHPTEEYEAITLRGVTLFSHPSEPAVEHRFKQVEGEVTGRIIKESSITDNYLLLRRTSMRPLFRLPKTFEIEVLSPQTGEPQVEITVGAG